MKKEEDHKKKKKDRKSFHGDKDKEPKDKEAGAASAP
jgi:hypothetical protein